MSITTKSNAFTLAAQLRPSILRLSRNLRREANHGGRSSLDVQILRALHDSTGTTVAELAAEEQMSRSAMGEHIKRLVLLGYVKRAGIRRGEAGNPISLSLTRTGRRYLEGVAQRRNDWLTSRLNTLSASERSALNDATRSLQLILDSAQSIA